MICISISGQIKAKTFGAFFEKKPLSLGCQSQPSPSVSIMSDDQTLSLESNNHFFLIPLSDRQTW